MTDPQDVAETNRAKHLAKAFVKFNTDDKGNFYAKLWERPEFKEAFDYGQGYEKKNMLKYKIDAVWRHTDMRRQLFQKVYYFPGLLAEDEADLRKKFVNESGSHDLRSSAINWTLATTFFPALWAGSTRFRGWGVVAAVSISYWFLYKQLHRVNSNMLQSNLNSFARPLVEKYNITDHHG